MTDFFEGKNLRQIMEEEGPIKDREITGRVLLAYAEMMNYLHERGLLFIDNSPSNILIGASDVKICDYDFVSSGKDLEEVCLAGKVFTRLYQPRERFLSEGPTMLGDLEGFAMVIHHIITGKPFLDLEDYKKEARERELAESNKRKYPAPKLVPPKLRQVMAGVLTYPRDDSIRAGDFVSAVRGDYKIQKP
jgi:serine/threonine protein kinase